MTALIDSGFLYATVDDDDTHYEQVTRWLATTDDELILPDIVMVEVTYLLNARLGHSAMRHFLRAIENSPIQFEPLLKTDIPRIYALLEKYADIELDFVDAAVVTLAERLHIQRILTVDQRDFRIIRPAHCDYFEIFP